MPSLKKCCLFSLILLLSQNKVFSQYQITGYTPVITGVNYGPYTISGGTWSTSDHWCAVGGTLNGTTNTCVNNNGTPSVSVTWTGSGTLSYYQSGSGTPVATYAVTAYTIVNNIMQNPNAEFAPNLYPYVPLSQFYTLHLTGSAVVIPTAIINYQWQISLDNVNYTALPNGATQNYTYSHIFTQTTWFRRVVSVTLMGQNYTSTSTPMQAQVAAALQPGILSPSYVLVASGASPGTFTATAVSGGTMCGGNYTYTWQTSPDNATWTNAGSGLTYTAGAITAKTYIRVLGFCGPMAGVSNTAVADVYSPLQGGTISPMNITIASGTGPGNLSCSPASGGNTALGYTYTWQSSTDGINFPAVTPAATSPDYNPGNLTATTYYRRKVMCNGQTAYSNIVTINIGTPTAYQNYVRTRMLTAGGITSIGPADALTALADVKQTTAYFDGLGRPVQSVVRQGSLITSASPAPTDLVVPIQYDPAGRQVFNYMPYVSTANNGIFKTNALPEQSAFNATQFQGQNEDFYYSQTNYESSPLERASGISAPGYSWTGSNRINQHLLSSNTELDQVMAWYVTNSGTVGVFGSYSYGNGFYAAGSLYKDISLDENGRQTITFTNLDGKVILKKVQLTAQSDDGTGTGHTGWLCTYYIYDNWNNLRCVVQPRGVELLTQNQWDLTALSGAILNEQCFRYEYDRRNRMIMKKTPGSGPVYMVYDDRDRLVMTQDANQRSANQWMVTLYEASFNRPVATGLYTTSTSFSSLLAAAGTSITYPFVLSGAPAYPTWETLTQTHYDNYTGIPTGVSSTLNTAVINMTNFYTSYNTSPLYAQPLTQSTPSTAVTTQGLATWAQVEVLGSGGTQYISTSNIYDFRARVIQQQTLNYSGGLDISTTQYNFTGNPLLNDLRHQLYSSGNPTPQTYEVVTRNTYDALNRTTKLEKMLITAAVPAPAWKTISTMSYDALGHMSTKTVGNDPANTGSSYVPLETMAHDYNIRGWLLGINRTYINSTSPTNYFGFELGYDKLNTIVPAAYYAIPQFNGNIGGMIWKNGGDGAIRKYDFTYDAANRLMGADFNQYKGGFSKSDGLDFSVSNLGYDANGNITKMTQMGWKGGGSAAIDILTYTPVANSNRLQNVIDAASDPITALGDFRYSTAYAATLPSGKTGATVDYSYDNNGNLISDKNKDITSITYNFLNLPAVMTVAGTNHNGTITYTYDAAGNKLAKKVSETNGAVSGTLTNITTTTGYTAGFVYSTVQYSASALATLQFTDKFQFCGHEEGRTRALYANPLTPTVITGFAYDYFLKDHLGNTRSVVTEETETDAYPALTFEGTTSTAVANQNAIWDNSSGLSIDVLSRQVTPLPTGFTSATSGTYCGSIIKTQGAIGAAKLLRVMAKDQLNVGIDYTYSSAAVDNTSANGLNTLVGSLAAMIMGSSDVGALLKGPGTASALAAAQNTTAVSNYLSVVNQEVPGSPGGPPKAYLHILLFNDQFVFDDVNSAVVPITTAGLNTKQTLTRVVSIPRDGYAYIYFSNESNTIVYFDNFNLTHIRGPLLETNSYYPFGLTMAGISDKALKPQYSENKFRYNGKELQNQEFSDGSGLEEYDYGARFFDPQLGRFFTIDNFAEKYYGLSPYHYAANNPANTIDINGDSIWVTSGGQSYYFGYTKDGGYGFYGGDGKKYSGDEEFVYDVATDLEGFANTNDQEVQDRMGVMMNSKFKVVIENGGCDGCGGDQLSDVIMKDGSRKSTGDKDFDIKNPNVIGAVVKWDPNTRSTGDNVRNPNGADADLELAHEFLGHGFQATVRQLDIKPQTYKDGEGNFPTIENDAQNISNRVARATHRADMVRPTYTMVKMVDDAPKKLQYSIQPEEAIKWNRNKKY